MKIKVKYHNPNCKFNFISKGEWIDLRASQTINFEAPKADELRGECHFDFKLIPLGFAMELPKGFEAHIAPRSSTYKSWGLVQTNSIGVVDNSFSGNNDIWQLPVIAYKNTCVLEGERICQFRIQLSQKASIWTKIKWLFTNKIEFVEVEDLHNANRGGFGTSNCK